MLLKNQWVNDEIKEEIKKYLEANDNKNTTKQKSVGCSKSSTMREVHSDTGLPQKARKISNNLTNHLKEFKKEEETKRKVSRRKEMIKIKEKINKIEILKNRKKSIKPRADFLERVNKINKPLASLTKKKRERTQINKIGDERGEITTNNTEIQQQQQQKPVREYYDQFYANKFDNLEEMGKFLETYSPPKLNKEEIDNFNRLVTRSKIEFVIKKQKRKQENSLKTKVQDQMASLGKNLHQSFSNSSKRLKKRKHSQSHSMKPSP